MSPGQGLIRPWKKAHLPPACAKQAFRIAALDRCGNRFRSKRSRSNVLPKYASAHRQAQGGEEDRTTRRFLARRSAELGRSLAPGTFLTGL